MDKTEIFVKMCEKAEEIQRMSPRIVITTNTVNIHVYDLEGDCWFNRNNEKAIWLPSQDQLQEIAFEHLKQKYPAYEDGKITGYNYNAFNLLNAFDDYVSIFHSQAILSPNHNIIETTSIEQLWLRFVMNRVYDRIWSGGEWMYGQLSEKKIKEIKAMEKSVIERITEPERWEE